MDGPIFAIEGPKVSEAVCFIPATRFFFFLYIWCHDFNTQTTPDFKITGHSYTLCNHKGLLQLTLVLFGEHVTL